MHWILIHHVTGGAMNVADVGGLLSPGGGVPVHSLVVED